jgi:DNA-binding GntR family transcriptional regulator
MRPLIRRALRHGKGQGIGTLPAEEADKAEAVGISSARVGFLYANTQILPSFLQHNEEHLLMTQIHRPKPVLSQAIAAELEAEILLGKITAGSKLDEAALARRFGVSRTPVREALQIVVARALAVRQPYKGVLVSDISPERIDQLFEAMAEIEALCGRFAAQRMTAQERAALRSAHEAMADLVQSGDAARYEEANTRFHQLIYSGSHNEDIADMAETMRMKLAPFRRSQLANAARIATSNAEHARIVTAIVAGDGAGAEQALRHHLLSAARAMLDQFEASRAVPMAARPTAS